MLDKAPQGIVEKVERLLESYSDVKKFHSLKIRTAGADTFIKFNIHLNPSSSLKDVHELCDRIEKDLNAAIPRSEIYIHAEPQDISHLTTETENPPSPGANPISCQ